MRKLIAIAAVTVSLAACNGASTTEVTTDSTTATVDTTKACCDSTKCDSTKVVDTAKEAK